VLPKEQKLNTEYYMSAILQSFVAWRQTHVIGLERKLIVHADDPKFHTAKARLTFFEQNSLKMALYPLYSPDLATYDFFLFENVKKLLAWQSFADLDELFEALLEILRQIPHNILIRTFREWISRLFKFISINCQQID
jgi:hypothetical protein